MVEYRDENLQNSHFLRVDLSRSRLHGVMMQNVRITDAWVNNVEISCLLGSVIDNDARPTFDEVLDVRAQRMASVAALLAGSDEQDLARTVPNPNGGTASVGACISVVLGEEWAHDRYANRDLDALGAPASD